MVSAWSSRHGISCSRHLSRTQAEIPIILAVQISRATSVINITMINPIICLPVKKNNVALDRQVNLQAYMTFLFFSLFSTLETLWACAT